MVLSETLIANTSLVSKGLSKRINLYEYFTTDNATHIICGNQSMPKECGIFLALKQGKKNRKLYNKAWMASELDHHGTYAEGLACLKVSFSWLI